MHTDTIKNNNLLHKNLNNAIMRTKYFKKFLLLQGSKSNLNPQLYGQTTMQQHNHITVVFKNTRGEKKSFVQSRTCSI